MRYGVAALVVMFLVIIGAVVLIGGGNDNGSQPAAATSRTTKLADYANNEGASVSWTVQGRIVGEDQFRAIRITVSRSTRKVEVLNGYNLLVEKSTELPNTAAAFETFTRALDNLGFGRERNVALADERGVCPQGNRYIYRLTDGSKEVMRTWSDTCSSKDGPFAGKAPSTIQRLFRDQITDYNKFVSGVRLNSL